ncbi:MAG: MFS transporter [Oscillospiraceae bacterium]|nr:MFS transporter [Oscillospiraceae bacterium]
MNSKRESNLTVTILSLSLLTVMAGAAVAPALGVIQEYFKETGQMLVQMIISIPALFIALTNIVFPKLCRLFKSKTLLMAGLALYVLGGCMAGLFSNIYLVLIFRALVGVGVGIIMPMSTGLLAFYYPADKQDKLMGYSSAMNQMGGVVATLISGVLANISWRASFLVYLMGLISVVLVLIYLPNDKIVKEDGRKEKGSAGKYLLFILSMFVLMFSFFVFPSSFAIETIKEGIIEQKYISIIMAGMDLVAFAGGLSFVHIKKRMGLNTRFAAPAMFFAGYLCLFAIGGWGGALSGSVLVGFANGLGIPFLISTASRKAGKNAATSVIPLLSIAMYLAQFTTPVLLSGAGTVLSLLAAEKLPYLTAVLSSVLMFILAFGIKE